MNKKLVGKTTEEWQKLKLVCKCNCHLCMLFLTWVPVEISPRPLAARDAQGTYVPLIFMPQQ